MWNNFTFHRVLCPYITYNRNGGDLMERLRVVRQKQHLTQKDIAAFLGVDRTTYVKYETGKSEPSFETLQKNRRFL